MRANMINFLRRIKNQNCLHTLLPGDKEEKGENICFKFYLKIKITKFCALKVDNPLCQGVIHFLYQFFYFKTIHQIIQIAISYMQCETVAIMLFIFIEIKSKSSHKRCVNKGESKNHHFENAIKRPLQIISYIVLKKKKNRIVFYYVKNYSITEQYGKFGNLFGIFFLKRATFIQIRFFKKISNNNN